MPSAFRNPKDLPNWFELHYYRWPSYLPRLRKMLIWGTFLVTLVVVVALCQPLSPCVADFSSESVATTQGDNRALSASGMLRKWR